MKTEVMDAPAAPAPGRRLKRTADDSFDDDHRFAKRFNLLNLGMSIHLPCLPFQQMLTLNCTAKNSNDKLYIPVSSRPQLHPPHVPSSSSSTEQQEHMQLDDTKHRVYIHNLADELDAIETAEQEEQQRKKLVFLPDIDKQFNQIPRHILTGKDKEEASNTQELILYDLPPSLSVAPEQDNVRKAILEARQRAKDRATNLSLTSSLSSTADGQPPEDQIETAHGYDSPDYELDEQDVISAEEEVDAMDLS
jgi:hypothetical protein